MQSQTLIYTLEAEPVNVSLYYEQEDGHLFIYAPVSEVSSLAELSGLKALGEIRHILWMRNIEHRFQTRLIEGRFTKQTTNYLIIPGRYKYQIDQLMHQRTMPSTSYTVH